MFRLIPVSEIQVLPGRQRSEMGDLGELISSIEENTSILPKTLGLINPIVVRNGNILVAGERRYRSFKVLGRKEIPAIDLEDLSPEDAEILELEENVKRKDVEWPERARAIQKIHLAFLQKDSEWTQTQTARRLGMASQAIAKYLAVADELQNNPKIAEITSVNTAMNLISRANERKLDDVVLAIEADLVSPIPLSPATPSTGVQIDIEDILLPTAQTLPATPIPPQPILRILPALDTLKNEDFIQWAKTYRGKKFNFIHCDFPYAAGAKSGSQIHAGSEHEIYEDTPEVFWKLFNSLLDSMSNVIADSAHIMFWYQTGMFGEVYSAWKDFEKMYDLSVLNVPMIWHKSDNSGVLSDPSRRPRHIYETALLITRGDRKIIGAKADVYSCPISRQIHPSEKPIPMLQHFFQMFLSDTSRVLDPTAGSATSIRAAELFDVEYSLGFEISEKFHREACIELESSRKKRVLAEHFKAKEKGNTND